MKYKLEVVKSNHSITQSYVLSISLDKIIEMCRNAFGKGYNLYLTDEQDNEIAYRELGNWTISR